MKKNLCLYEQETDIEIIEALFPLLNSKEFLDIGAEKGSFTEQLLKVGFTAAYLFEPLPSHQKILQTVYGNNLKVKIYNYAIDNEDKQSEFNIAYNDEGAELNYFHSLNKIDSHEYFKHSKTIPIQCRTLKSLAEHGEIPKNISLIKIDTEGNDLNVLEGMGSIKPDILITEFVPPDKYHD